ncbi:hypothetical protein WJX74_006589 [Apatococcus lobatus]|uniref:Uncharacterized protein n=1 Tax=Apatococcus lobatus TaxID=904363 RepID=A0AAW1RXX9_9CHLO
MSGRGQRGRGQRGRGASRIDRGFQPPSDSRVEKPTVVHDQGSNAPGGSHISTGSAHTGTTHTPSWQPADIAQSSGWDLVDMLAFAAQLHLTALEQACLDQLTETQHGKVELQSDGRLLRLESDLLGKLVQELAGRYCEY